MGSMQAAVTKLRALADGRNDLLAAKAGLTARVIAANLARPSWHRTDGCRLVGLGQEPTGLPPAGPRVAVGWSVARQLRCAAHPRIHRSWWTQNTQRFSTTTEARTWMSGDFASGIEGCRGEAADSRTGRGSGSGRRCAGTTHRADRRGGDRHTLEQPTSLVADRYTREGELVIVSRNRPPSQQRSGAPFAAVLIRTDDHPWSVRIGVSHFGGTRVHLVRGQLR
jgi:hypothetical protein